MSRRRTRVGWLPALVALALFARPAQASGAPGELDGGFGTGGAVLASDHNAQALASRASDGAVVIGGQRPKGTFNGSTTQEWIVRRYTTTGQIDASFAGGGLFTRFGAYGVDGVNALACDASGRTLAVGNARFEVTTGTGRKTSTSYQSRGVVLRLDTQGALDTTFGSGGEVTLAFPVFAVAVLSDGRILVAGQSGGDPAVVRLLSDGTLDGSYGSGGIAVDARSADVCGRVMGIGVQSTGAAVLGWRGSRTVKSKGSTTTTQVWHVTRMTPAGAPDGTFAATERTGVYMGGIVVGADDRIFASGGDAATGAGVVVTAHVADGALDSSFGMGGQLAWASHAAQTSVGTPVLQSDGKLLIPSHFSDGTWQAAPIRILPAGTLDLSFGPSGEGQALSLGTGVQTRTWGLALAPGGGILMVGDYIGSPSGVYAARYVP